MEITVAKCAFKHAADMTLGKVDSHKLDSLANTCIARAIAALKGPTPGYGERDRMHILRIFSDLKMTHKTIRCVLEGVDPPESVDSLVLARVQLEALYVLCLMFEDASYVTRYLQDGWRKKYVQYLYQKAECAGLPRFDEFLRNAEPWILGLRNDCGITEEQQRTVDFDQLGIPLPAGMSRVPIERFPTPKGVISKIPPGPKRKMLMRLYPEYEHLSSFTHGLAEASFLRGMFDKRSEWPELFTSGKKEETFNKLVSSPAVSFSFLCIIQACAELTTLYPDDVELRAGVTEAWDYPASGYLIGMAVWGLRTKSLLGAIG